jgi:aspartate aminotransferase-like enzyme
MNLLPDTERILLGPGASLTSPRVMRAMASPTISHLDPLMIKLLDDVRARLLRLFRAPEGSFALRKALKASPADVVAMVHAETSTGVLNSVRKLELMGASSAPRLIVLLLGALEQALAKQGYRPAHA